MALIDITVRNIINTFAMSLSSTHLSLVSVCVRIDATSLWLTRWGAAGIRKSGGGEEEEKGRGRGRGRGREGEEEEEDQGKG